MSVPILKAYRPDGSSRALWRGPFVRPFRRHGVMPVRGSHVIAITEGPRRGFFHVDFSPLAAVTGDDKYAVCMVQTFETHEEAVAAEQQWLLANWILEPWPTALRQGVTMAEDTHEADHEKLQKDRQQRRYYRKEARRLYHRDRTPERNTPTIEVDEGAEVSYGAETNGNAGAWVAAWIWVPPQRT